jgi:hypothetical protein
VKLGCVVEANFELFELFEAKEGKNRAERSADCYAADAGAEGVCA